GSGVQPAQAVPLLRTPHRRQQNPVEFAVAARLAAKYAGRHSLRTALRTIWRVLSCVGAGLSAQGSRILETEAVWRRRWKQATTAISFSRHCPPPPATARLPSESLLLRPFSLPPPFPLLGCRCRRFPPLSQATSRHWSFAMSSQPYCCCRNLRFCGHARCSCWQADIFSRRWRRFFTP